MNLAQWVVANNIFVRWLHRHPPANPCAATLATHVAREKNATFSCVEILFWLIFWNFENSIALSPFLWFGVRVILLLPYGNRCSTGVTPAPTHSTKWHTTTPLGPDFVYVCDCVECVQAKAWLHIAALSTKSSFSPAT